MHYSARWGKNQSLRIGVATANSPGGPFMDVFNRPLFDFGYAAMDGHVLIDDDGSKYFYCPRDCSENVIDGSERFIVYHIHTDSQNPSGDRMGFREDGSLHIIGPTHTPQSIPSSKE